MRKLRFRFIFVFLVLCLAFSSAQAAPLAQDTDGDEPEALIFDKQRVDAPRFFSWMSQRSIRVDSSGRSHVVYGGDHLYYAVKNGPSWTTRIVDESDNVGMFASIALDSAGHPHVSYYAYAMGQLRYAYYNGSYWDISIVDEPPAGMAVEPPLAGSDLDAGAFTPGMDSLRESSGPISATLGLDGNVIEGAEPPPVIPFGVGLYTSIAIDNNGYPAISYYDAIQGAVKVARWNGSSWLIQMVDNTGNTGLYTSLAINSAGRPEISYYDATTLDLKYAKWSGSAWQLATVDSTGDVGQYSSIVIDNQGKAHISYYDATNTSLKHARTNGTSWTPQTVIGSDSTDVGLYSSIAAPKSGDRLHISYFDKTNSRLKYALYTGSAWEIYDLPLGSVFGRYTSATLDGSSRVHISYYDSGLGQIREAYLGASGTESTIIDTSYDVGYHVDLAMDASFTPHIAYHDDIHDDLRYARWNGTSWVVQVIDPASQGGLYTSLALTSGGQPRISFYDYGTDRIKYAAWNGSNWEISFLTTALGSIADEGKGMSTALALDPTTGFARVAYYQGSTDSARLLVYNGIDWVSKQIDGGTDKGRYIDMVIDSAGNIHVAYMEGSHSSATQALKYAMLDQDGDLYAGYPITVPDASDSDGFFPSITLDNNGLPHIAYFDDNGDILKHAWNNGTGWQSEVVEDSDDSIGWYPAINVSPTGTIHISYYNATLGDLKLATKTGATWSVQTLDSVGDVGKFSAVDYNENGLLALAYTDATNGDLIYTNQIDFNPSFYLYLPLILK